MIEKREYSPCCSDNEQEENQNVSQPFDPMNFGLFVFQPLKPRFKKSFFTMTFQKRLDILEANIIDANLYLTKSLNKDSQFKSMFVGPEYLFKKHHQKGSKQYYSEKKKI